MTEYRFPTKIEKIAGLLRTELEWLPPDRERGLIGERQASSFAEYMVAMALWFLRIEFRYKHSILHTPYYVDFYIFTGVDWIPLDVNQRTGVPLTGQDRLRVRVIEVALSMKLNLIYADQVRTFEGALDAVRAIL